MRQLLRVYACFNIIITVINILSQWLEAIFIKTRAVRLYGKGDLRLESFELPPIKDDEILIKVITDSLCMSTYKAAMLGPEHKRVPKDVDKNPVIVGHELCGEIAQVGAKWGGQYSAGQKVTVQPALNYKGSMDSPGYSFKFCGGDATYMILPHQVMELGCLIPFNGSAYFYGSLSEPVSCILGAYHASYHTTPLCYKHSMGIKEGGALALLAAAGPMGLGALDYALSGQVKPSIVVVTDTDKQRLRRAGELFSVDSAAKKGIKLVYSDSGDADFLLSLTGGNGFDDVMVYAPVRSVVELADKILARDGCLNFFAGPVDNQFSAALNFYNVHYQSTHIVGTTGGGTADMKEALDLMADGSINPAVMITHIGGLDAVADATLNLPNIGGGKKLIYTQIDLPLTAIDDFEKLAAKDELFKGLSQIVKQKGGLWCPEAEQFLLQYKT